jgi:hypothetical protein
MDVGFQLIQVAGLDIGVWLHTANDPAPAEWTRACQAVAALLSAKKGSVATLRKFVITDGGAPNATQRKQMNQDTLRGVAVKTVVITSVLRTNPIKRGIVTALQWINPAFRVFEPHDVLLALDHIGVTRVGFESIWATLSVMQRTLAPNETLRLVASRLGLLVLE